jgi:hypothetical protein
MAGVPFEKLTIWLPLLELLLDGQLYMALKSACEIWLSGAD